MKGVSWFGLMAALAGLLMLAACGALGGDPAEGPGQVQPGAPTSGSGKLPFPTQIPSNTPTAVPPTSTLTPTHTLAPTATSTPTPALLLPDLQNMPPAQLRIAAASGGRRYVHFTNAVWNSGDGLLELVGRPDQDAEQIRVFQNVFTPDGQVLFEREVGLFLFHPLHNHWHMDNFAEYEVWSVAPTGDLIRRVSAGRKVSFCVTDLLPAQADPFVTESFSEPAFPECNSRRQGLSPGWVDVYYHTWPDQWVEVTSLRDGIYALVSTVNPLGAMLETEMANNRGITYFELQGFILRLVERPDAEPEPIPPNLPEQL